MYRPVEMESRSLRMVVNIVCPWRKESRRNVKSADHKRPISSRLIPSPNLSQTSKWQNDLGTRCGILEKKKKSEREEKFAPKREKVNLSVTLFCK